MKSKTKIFKEVKNIQNQRNTFQIVMKYKKHHKRLTIGHALSITQHHFKRHDPPKVDNRNNTYIALFFIV